MPTWWPANLELFTLEEKKGLIMMTVYVKEDYLNKWGVLSLVAE